MLAALRHRDFRLLLAGQTISRLGDQFHLIALPWLVLSITHDPLQLGGVLAVAGIPRALLMLVGGAWADRYSPRTIMLVSDVLRGVVSAALATVILSGRAELWMVYLLAAAFGTVSGFFMPAVESTVPRLLPAAELESGNATIMGGDQLMSFLGPAAAGVLIATFGSATPATAEQTASLTGIGAAFAIDATTFMLSAIALAFIAPIPSGGATAGTHPFREITEGIRYAMSVSHVRVMVTIIALANMLMVGPLLVGLPVLARDKLLGGAAAYGALVSAFGLGSLVGMFVAGSRRRPSDAAFGWLAVAIIALFGVTVAAMGVIESVWIGGALMLVTGAGNGYIAVVSTAALQRVTPRRYLGRTMALVMLATVGLTPLSQAVSGAIVRHSPTALFASSGAGLLLLAMWAVGKRGVWRLGTDAAHQDDARHAAKGASQSTERVAEPSTERA